MPVTFGGLIGSMAKNAVKNVVKRKGLDIVDTAIKYYAKDNSMQVGKYFLHKAFNKDVGVKDIYKGYKAVNQALHIGNVSNAKQLYDKGKSIYNKVNSLTSKDKKILAKIEKQLDFKLNEFDTAIFKFSQAEGRRGRFDFEELVAKDNGRFLANISKNLGSLEGKEFSFGKYDANVVFKYFKEGDLTLDELKYKLDSTLKNSNEADREFIILSKRIEKLREHEYVNYDEVSKSYSISPKGAKEAIDVRSRFEFSSYDANVLFQYIENAKGSLSIDELEKQLDTQYKSIEEKLKQLEYIEGRLEKNTESGYLQRDSSGEYSITEKGFEACKVFFEENIEKARERLQWLENMNFINFRVDGIVEVTDMFYYNLEIRDLLDPKEILVENEKERVKEEEERQKEYRELKISNYDKYVIRELENYPDGINLEGIYQKYKEDITVQNEARRANSFVRACEKLYNNGYLMKIEDKYYLHSNTRIMVYGELKFSYADERILRDLKKNPLSLSEENLKIKFEDNIEKIKMILGRAKRLEGEGYIQKYGEGYKITDLGVEKQKEFKNSLNYIFKGFTLGKYDAETIFKLFGADNKLNLDELKDRLLEKFEIEKVENHLQIISEKIEEFKNNELLSFDEKSNTYSITEKGFKEIEFKLKAYDTRSIFSLFSTENTLSLEDLKKDVNTKITDVKEAERTLMIVEARINKLEENGYISFDGETGLYSITEKGFEEAKKMKEEILFGKYDYEVIFSYFGTNNSLTIENLKEQLSKKFEDPEELNKNLNISRGRINKLTDNGYIKYDSIEKSYSITEKGFEEARVLQEVKVSKYDANVLFRNFGKENALTLEQLKENLNEKFADVKDAEKQYKIMSARINKLQSKGFLDYDDKTKVYSVSEKGFEAAKAARDKFEFTSYDVNVIFGYIDKADESLTLEQLDEMLKQEYKSQSDRLDQFEYLKNRIQKNVDEGYLKEIEGSFVITEKGIAEASEIIEKQEARRKYIENRKSKNIQTNDIVTDVIEKQKIEKKMNVDNSDFKLTPFDTQIFNKAKDGINLEDKLNEFRDRYKDNSKELKRQMRMWESRCVKLEGNGYLKVDEKTGVYSLSEKALDYLNSKDNKSNSDSKQFELTKYDINYVFKLFDNGTLKLDELEKVFKNKYTGDEYDRQIKIFTGRLNKLYNNKILSYEENKRTYSITDLGMSDIEKFKLDSIKSVDEVRELAEKHIINDRTVEHINMLHTERKFPDKSYFNSNFNYMEEIKNTLLDKESRIEKTLDNKTQGFCFYKTYPNPIGKDYNGQDLFTIRVVLNDNSNVVTAYPIQINNIVTDKFYITKFDYSNIFEVSVDNKWNKSYLKQRFNDLSDNMFYNKALSVEKRLKTLEELNAVKYIGNGTYELTDFYIERAKLTKEKGLSKLTHEQKAILNDLKDFYNLTDSQIKDNIYKEFSQYAKNEADKLVSNGYINVTSRDLYGDGNFTDVYYLTSKGKKAISHISGQEVDRIFDSKLHNRPEELKHDLYVYSAYKDIEKQLQSNGIVIDKHFTDKDLRSLDMKTQGQQRIEYPDLRIEFTDIKTGEKGFINVEVDCGYKPNIIKSKDNNIENLVWYTDSQKQAEKIINVTKSNKVVVINL